MYSYWNKKVTTRENGESCLFVVVFLSSRMKIRSGKINKFNLNAVRVETYYAIWFGTGPFAVNERSPCVQKPCHKSHSVYKTHRF